MEPILLETGPVIIDEKGFDVQDTKKSRGPTRTPTFYPSTQSPTALPSSTPSLMPTSTESEPSTTSLWSSLLKNDALIITGSVLMAATLLFVIGLLSYKKFHKLQINKGPLKLVKRYPKYKKSEWTVVRPGFPTAVPPISSPNDLETGNPLTIDTVSYRTSSNIFTKRSNLSQYQQAGYLSLSSLTNSKSTELGSDLAATRCDSSYLDKLKSSEWDLPSGVVAPESSLASVSMRVLTPQSDRTASVVNVGQELQDEVPPPSSQRQSLKLDLFGLLSSGITADDIREKTSDGRIFASSMESQKQRSSHKHSATY